MKQIVSFIAVLLLLLSAGRQAVASERPVLNEIFPHPNSSLKEWVELYNPEHIAITTFWLDDDTSFSDDSGNAGKKSLSGVVNTNPTFPYLEVSSFLNNTGDTVVLFDQEGNILDEYEYTGDPGVDIALGREHDGASVWGVMKTVTRGSENSGFFPTPTPTPEPTEKPSATPTRTPTPKKTPTPTKSPTPTKTPTSAVDIRENGATGTVRGSSTSRSSPTPDYNIPTAVLAARDGKAVLTPNAENSLPETHVLGSSSFSPGILIAGLGAILLISAGGYGYYTYRKNH